MKSGYAPDMHNIVLYIIAKVLVKPHDMHVYNKYLINYLAGAVQISFQCGPEMPLHLSSSYHAQYMVAMQAKL